MVWIAIPSITDNGGPCVYAVEADPAGQIALGIGATQHDSKEALETAYTNTLIVWPDETP